MHHRELVDLAAVLATDAQTLIYGVAQFPDHHLENYWAWSKCRQQRWWRLLRSYQTQLEQPYLEGHAAHWRTIRPVLEEILTAEILTRIWTAVAIAHDRAHGARRCEPIVRSIFVGHLEARHRALNVMIDGQQFDVEEAANMNRLRHRCERWTDLLLGQLVGHGDLRDLAFDPARTRDFAADHHFKSRPENTELAWQLMLASLHSAFQHGLSSSSPNADLNNRIAESIVSCLPAPLLDSTGRFSFCWLIRLQCMTNQTQGMIDEYLSLNDH